MFPQIDSTRCVLDHLKAKHIVTFPTMLYDSEKDAFSIEEEDLIPIRTYIEVSNDLLAKQTSDLPTNRQARSTPARHELVAASVTASGRAEGKRKSKPKTIIDL